jgi:hypothetical protein
MCGGTTMSAISISLNDILTVLVRIEVLQEGSEVMTRATLMALVIQILFTAIEITTCSFLITL